MRPIRPTGRTCLGLVQHLILTSSSSGSVAVLVGETIEPGPSGAVPAPAWQVSPGTPPEVIFVRYRHESEMANAMIAATALDAEPATWPEWWSNWRPADLREIILHVNTATACRAGHLDAARELHDTHTWLISPRHRAVHQRVCAGRPNSNSGWPWRRSHAQRGEDGGGPAFSRVRTSSIRPLPWCGISQRLSSHQSQPASSQGATRSRA